MINKYNKHILEERMTMTAIYIGVTDEYRLVVSLQSRHGFQCNKTNRSSVKYLSNEVYGML